MPGTSPPLSGSIFMDKAHGVIFCVPSVWRRFGTRRRIKPCGMRIAYSWTPKARPWHRSKALWKTMGGARGADFDQEPVGGAAYGQLRGGELREIVTGLRASGRLYHGRGPVGGRRLGANAQRPVQCHRPVAMMMKQAPRPAAQAAETTYLIDATSARLNEAAPAGAVSAGVCGAKVHVITMLMPIARSMPQSPRPRSTTSPWPSKCRSSRRHLCLRSGYYDYAWWLNSTPSAAGSSPGSSQHRLEIKSCRSRRQ